MLLESLPQTFVGLRNGVSLALVIIVVAEMFIGSDNGLGHRIIDAQQVMNVKSMYAAILSAGILGYTLNMLFLDFMAASDWTFKLLVSYGWKPDTQNIEPGTFIGTTTAPAISTP